MAFSKSFPKTVKGSAYPLWEEVFLTEKEERTVEGQSKTENLRLMKECISEAQKLAKESSLQPYQSDVIAIAIALFEKQASHTVYWKESKAKDKFEQRQHEDGQD